MTTRRWILLILVIAAGLLILCCGLLAAYRWLGDPGAEPTPAGARVYPTLPSPTVVLQASSTPTPILDPTVVPNPIKPPVTETPSTGDTATPPPSTDTPLPPDTPTAPAPSGTPPLPSPTATLPPPTPTQPAPLSPTPKTPGPPSTPTASPGDRPPLPPQQGASWDMEAGFVPGASPLGEDCPGWSVAEGWQAFLAPGTPASSCLNENKNLANVKSGQRSQEITFDFISAEAGIYRHAQAISGHRYQIEAWGKHVRSQSPVELSLGVDLSGGEDWQASSVTSYPWDETGEDVWVHTQVVVQATGEALTIFLKGHHPFAAQGGATLFDDVRVVDLGH